MVCHNPSVLYMPYRYVVTGSVAFKYDRHGKERRPVLIPDLWSTYTANGFTFVAPQLARRLRTIVNDRRQKKAAGGRSQRPKPFKWNWCDPQAKRTKIRVPTSDDEKRGHAVLTRSLSGVGESLPNYSYCCPV